MTVLQDFQQKKVQKKMSRKISTMRNIETVEII